MKRLLFLLTLCPALLHAASPLDVARRVADKVVDNTRFGFEYKLQGAYPDAEHIDFGRSTDREGVVYALTSLRCEGTSDELFEIGCTGPVQIAIDDSVVFRRTQPRPFDIRFGEKNYTLPESFRVRLSPGEHRLLIKTRYAGGEHLFLMQSRNLSRYAEPGRKIVCSIKSWAPRIEQSRWLILGSFDGELSTPLLPDSALLFHTPYHCGERTLSWNIPPVNILSAPTGESRFYEWNYHTGCFAWALQRLSAATSDPKYAVYADAWCDFSLATRPLARHQTRRLHAVRSFNFGAAGRPMLDYMSAPAMPYITRCTETPDAPAAYRAEAEAVLGYLRHEQFRTAGVFARVYTPSPSIWADDMFMGLPYLVYGYRLTGERTLLCDAVEQLLQFHRLLCDPQSGLYRQACYPSQPELRVPFWSRGNGWALWATCEVLDALPRSHKDYKKVLSIYRSHIDALLRCQDDEGFWRNILDRPQSVRESSGAAIFTYSIARGIDRGWLPRKGYEHSLRKAWKALETFITPDGDFNGVKGGTNFSTAPEDYERVPFIRSDTHGLLPLLFAAMEVEKVLK